MGTVTVVAYQRFAISGDMTTDATPVWDSKAEVAVLRAQMGDGLDNIAINSCPECKVRFHYKARHTEKHGQSMIVSMRYCFNKLTVIEWRTAREIEFFFFLNLKHCF